MWLMLLHLTSAFDTVDHALLLTCLQRSFSVEGVETFSVWHGLCHICQVEATAWSSMVFPPRHPCQLAAATCLSRLVVT